MLLLNSRPKCVSDVAHQDEVVAVLKKSVQGADVSHIILRCGDGILCDY
jgi:hypothetical protein